MKEIFLKMNNKKEDNIDFCLNYNLKILKNFDDIEK